QIETATWKRVQSSAPANRDLDRRSLVWLVIVAKEPLDERFASELRDRGDEVTVLEKGRVFTELRDGRFSCDFTQEADIDKVCAASMQGLAADEVLQVVYFCNPSRPRPPDKVASEYRREVDDKINGPIALIRSLTRHAKPDKINLTLVTRD